MRRGKFMSKEIIFGLDIGGTNTRAALAKIQNRKIIKTYEAKRKINSKDALFFIDKAYYGQN